MVSSDYAAYYGWAGPPERGCQERLRLDGFHYVGTVDASTTLSVLALAASPELIKNDKCDKVLPDNWFPVV